MISFVPFYFHFPTFVRFRAPLSDIRCPLSAFKTRNERCSTSYKQNFKMQVLSSVSTWKEISFQKDILVSGKVWKEIWKEIEGNSICKHLQGNEKEILFEEKNTQTCWK